MTTSFDCIWILWWDSDSISLFKLDNVSGPKAKIKWNNFVGYLEKIHMQGSDYWLTMDILSAFQRWLLGERIPNRWKKEGMLSFFRLHQKYQDIFLSVWKLWAAQIRPLESYTSNIMKFKYLAYDFRMKIMRVVEFTEFTEFLHEIDNSKFHIPLKIVPDFSTSE